MIELILLCLLYIFGDYLCVVSNNSFRLIDSSLVFKVLYSLITFGVVLDPEFATESWDPPDQMIRYQK